MFSRKITRKVFNRSSIRTVLLLKKKYLEQLLRWGPIVGDIISKGNIIYSNGRFSKIYLSGFHRGDWIFMQKQYPYTLPMNCWLVSSLLVAIYNDIGVATIST